ncbi:MFS transporter [Phytohabitans houttuyneae]|uniref:MFS transporter n=1 Tax=Phytohabitans houttuyneae TaxID=1076126 RepID=UPI001C49C67E|nr:MFS transporter [Phytohabitans houttuyneae]
MKVLLFASTLTVMAGAVLSPVVELLRVQLGLSATAAGLVVTVHGASLALAGPLVGRAFDRWGTRRPLAAGLLLYGVAGGAGLVVEAYPLLIATRLAFGVGAAFVFTGTTVALLDRYDGPRRDRVMGWRSTAISLGGVVWPLAGGALGALSWHAPFAVYLLGVPLALLAWRLPGDHPHRPPAGRGSGRPVWNPALLGVYALQCAATALLYAVLVFLPARLAGLGVTSTLAVALFSAALSLAMSAAGLAYPRLRARFGHSGLLRLAFAAWTLALLALAAGGTAAVPLAAAVLFGAGMGVAVPALTVLTGDLAPPGRRGQATALLATAGFAGQFAAPLAFGPLDRPPAVFLAAAGLAAAALLATALTGRRDRRANPAGAEPPDRTGPTASRRGPAAPPRAEPPGPDRAGSGCPPRTGP